MLISNPRCWVAFMHFMFRVSLILCCRSEARLATLLMQGTCTKLARAPQRSPCLAEGSHTLPGQAMSRLWQPNREPGQGCIWSFSLLQVNQQVSRYVVHKYDSQCHTAHQHNGAAHISRRSNARASCWQSPRTAINVLTVQAPWSRSWPRSGLQLAACGKVRSTPGPTTSANTP